MRRLIKYILFIIGITNYAQTEQIETNYSYDDLNRLVQVVFNDGSTHDYVYDDLGNRVQLHIQTLDIDEETLKSTITVYPNPTDSFLNIKLPNGFDLEDISIQLYDINGKLISGFNPTQIEGQIRIDVNVLSNGVYLLHFKSNHKKWSKLFIKK